MTHVIDLRHAAQGLVLLVVMVASLLVAPPTAEAATDQAAEKDFAALVNIERAKRGLHSLPARSDLRRVARSHSVVMANQSYLHHNPTLTSDVSGWQRIAENVGRGPSVSSLHKALMDSPGHRANILDDRVTELGIGVEVRGSTVWVTQVFRRPSGTVTLAPVSLTLFGDVMSTDLHAASITDVSRRGIANGCSTSRFCRSSTLTRAQMATMLANALDLTPSSTSRFTDVSGVHAGNITALAEAGIAAGCGDGRFCPNRKVTREQMATFLSNALELVPLVSSFVDVSDTHDGAVGALAAAGITSGCGDDRYCPTDALTRAQAAALLSRAL